MHRTPGSKSKCPGLQRLIRYAEQEGWTIMRHPDGSVRLHKAGLPPIFTMSLACPGVASPRQGNHHG